MLLEFSVGNFLSFRDKKTLSLEATSITDFQETNVIIKDKYKLLKSAVIYGANSSGKTNLLRGLSTMRQIIISSAKQSSTETLPVIPFLLSSETLNKPSFFEALFIIQEKRYRYGFEITQKAVITEWLYEVLRTKERLLFIREKDKIQIEDIFTEGMNLEEKTRDNALFLAICDMFNGKISGQIMKWFKYVRTISGLEHEDYRSFTFSMLEAEKTKEQLMKFFSKLDLGFDKVIVSKNDFNPAFLPKGIPEEILKKVISDLQGKTIVSAETLHKKFNKDGKVIDLVKFDLRNQESDGTNKVFDLSGHVFNTLRKGGVLVIDELDAKLHPLLTNAIVKLFNSKEFNPCTSQLIFATHDTNLLSMGNFRRDQIYFVEKDHFEASDIYSLAEYKEKDGRKIRKDRSFEPDYIKGRYGAIPFIGNFENLFGHGKKS